MMGKRIAAFETRNPSLIGRVQPFLLRGY